MIRSLRNSSLSRAAAVSITRSLPHIHPSLSTQSYRSLSISSPTQAAGAVVAPASIQQSDAVAAPKSFSEIVEKNGGWIPFIGLGALSLIAKEIYILDAETLLATNFFAVVGLGWLMAGEAMHKAVEVAEAKRQQRVHDIYQLRIEAVKRDIKDFENSIGQVDLLGEIKREYNTVVAEVVKAKELKARKAAHDAVLSRLQQLKSKRDSEQAQYLTTVYDLTSDYVREQFAQLPASQKNAMIEHAIALIGQSSKGVLSADIDPVRKLYRDYLGNKMYEKDIAYGKKPSTQ